MLREPAPVAHVACSGHRVRAVMSRGAWWQRGRISTAGFRCAAQSFSVEPETKANVPLAVRDVRRRDHGSPLTALPRIFSRLSTSGPVGNDKKEARRQLRLATGKGPARGRRNTGHVGNIDPRGFPFRRQGLGTKRGLGPSARITRIWGVDRYRGVGEKLGCVWC